MDVQRSAVRATKFQMPLGLTLHTLCNQLDCLYFACLGSGQQLLGNRQREFRIELDRSGDMVCSRYYLTFDPERDSPDAG